MSTGGYRVAYSILFIPSECFLDAICGNEIYKVYETLWRLLIFLGAGILFNFVLPWRKEPFNNDELPYLTNSKWDSGK